MPNVACQICKTNFYVKPFHQKKGWGKYCSKNCQNQAQLTSIYVLCKICSTEIKKTPTQLKHSKSQNYFCSKSCQTKWRNTVYVGTKHHSWINGINAYRKIMRRAKTKEICTHCQLADKRVLIVHHLDHDRTNNVVSNLMWLCRNCHYLIHEGKTF